MIKRILPILILFIIFTSTAFAQKDVMNLPKIDAKRWHWGYYLGINNYDFNISPSTKGMIDDGRLGINTNTSLGFSVGLISDLKLNDYFNFRFEPGLDISKRELVYDREILDKYYNNGYPNPGNNDSIRKINSTYVNLPFLLKFGGERRHNIRPYLIGGFNLGIDLSSNEKSSSDNSSGEEGFRMTTLNYSWQVGAGIDWYLPYFKFTTEIRGSFGINDELIKDGAPPGASVTPWTDTIDKLQTRAVFLVLKFE